MTDQQIDLAMEQAAGIHKVAGKLLGCTRIELLTAISKSPALAAKWTKEKQTHEVVMAEQTVSRTPPLTREQLAPPVTPSDMVLAEQLAIEDAKFRKGLESFGFDKQDLEYAYELQKFHGKHYARAVDLLTGSMTVTAVRLDRLIQNLIKQLTATKIAAGLGGVDASKDEDLRETEKMYLKAITDACTALTNMAKTAHEGSAIRAKIEMWKEQVKAAKAAPSKARPGFAPLQAQKTEIRIDAGNGKVDIHPPK
jgi:hypothetical protein